MSNVRYEKATREQAKLRKKWLITVSVDGKHLGDDSCIVQLLGDLPTAQRIAQVALDLLKHAKSRK